MNTISSSNREIKDMLIPNDHSPIAINNQSDNRYHINSNHIYPDENYANHIKPIGEINQVSNAKNIINKMENKK
jgi:hypothetical protein